MAGLAWALIWVMQAGLAAESPFAGIPVTIWADALVQIEAAAGTGSWHAAAEKAHILRSIWFMAEQQASISYQHVKAHDYMCWNECHQT